MVNSLSQLLDVTICVSLFSPNYMSWCVVSCLCPYFKVVFICFTLQVIAISMDVFTDVDIFKEMIKSTLRGVAVYVLLDESHFDSFLSMTHRAGVNIHDLKVRTMQTEGKQFTDNLTINEAVLRQTTLHFLFPTFP